MPGLDEIDGEGLKEDEQLVYIAGPYTHGKWGENIQNAISAGQAVKRHGHVPFIPHTMTALWSIMYPSNNWIEFDLKWLEQCDSMLRLDGKSSGADTEVEFANDRGITVYGSVEEFKRKVDPTPYE